MDLAQRWGVTIIFPKVPSFTCVPHTQKRKMIWWLSLIRQRSQNTGLGSNTVNLKELNPNQYFSMLLWIMLLLNGIIKKKDFENLFFPILWTDLIFLGCFFYWSWIAWWFMFGPFEWIQMGQTVPLLFGSSTQNFSLQPSGKATK